MKDKASDKKPLNCEDIQELLFDYMSRELGDGRSDLVREHLRKCETCRNTLAEMEFTLDFLQESSKLNVPASKLSDKHYARLIRAMTHPFLDWVYTHHIMVSLIIALIALAVMFGVLRKQKIWRERNIGTPIPVFIGKPPPESQKIPGRPEPREITEVLESLKNAEAPNKEPIE